jgi:hypothetical protein
MNFLLMRCVKFRWNVGLLLCFTWIQPTVTWLEHPSTRPFKGLNNARVCTTWILPTFPPSLRFGTKTISGLPAFKRNMSHKQGCILTASSLDGGHGTDRTAAAHVSTTPPCPSLRSSALGNLIETANKVLEQSYTIMDGEDRTHRDTCLDI